MRPRWTQPGSAHDSWRSRSARRPARRPARHATRGAAALAARFGRAHQRRYGFTLDRPVEIVAVRVAAHGPRVPVRFRAVAPRPRAVRGPRVITLADATMVVARGWTARALAIGGRVLGGAGGAAPAAVRAPRVTTLGAPTWVVARGWTGRALAIGGWLLERA